MRIDPAAQLAPANPVTRTVAHGVAVDDPDDATRARVLTLFQQLVPFNSATAKQLERFVAQLTLHTLPLGHEIVRQGDYGDSLFVVLSGSVLVRLKRPSGAESVLAILRRGEIFGELSVLGDRPRQATVITNEPVEVVEARRDDIGRLLKSSPGILRHFDRLYRQRVIAANVFADPLFTDLTPAALEQLIDSSRMRALDKEEVVVAQGDPADAFYIVWSGHLRVSAPIDGQERVFAYLQEGDFFGETALVQRAPRTATVTANQASQVIEIRPDDFKSIVASDPAIMERIQSKVAERLGQLDSIKARPDMQAFIQDLLEHGAAHATSALVIDLGTCVRCGNCAAACHDRYGNSRLVRRGKEYVLPEGQARVLMPNSCWHCRDPECMIGCPTDALRRRPSGEIAIIEDRCIGCEICANQCPWGNITMAPTSPTAPAGALQRLFKTIREALQLARRPELDAAADDSRGYKAKAVKCDLCRDYDGKPACINACPYGSIDLVDPNAYLQAALEGG